MRLKLDKETLEYYQNKIDRKLEMYFFTKDQDYIEKAIDLVKEFQHEVDTNHQ